MSLRRKFLILLTVLVVTVSVNAGAALWAIVHFENAVVRPLASVQHVLANLRIVKRSLGEEHNIIVALSPGRSVAPIGPSNRITENRADLSLVSITHTLHDLKDLANEKLTFLENEVAAYELLAGTGTANNIRQRVIAAHVLVDRWLGSFTPSESGAQAPQPTASPAQALNALYQLHELIELTEGQVLASASIAMDFSKVLQRSVVFILMTSVLAVVAAGFLAIRLVRRWVLLPVSELRIAATRIGQGDFDHRVPVIGTGEIASLSSEVNHMASMVKSLQTEKIERERLAAVGEMVRRISHNLRNPLSGIRSLAELSRDEISPELEAREFQTRIMTTVDRFESWLKQLLNVSMPLTIAPRPTDLQPWLKGILEAHQPVAHGHGITLILDLDRAPDVAEIDPDHLEQAITALITNAIEASPPTTQVTITCENGQTRNTWTISVADQGSGVPFHLQKDIFRPYFTTKPDGNGIGLACVKQIVEQHGGSVEVKSPVRDGNPTPSNPGSVFVLTFSKI